MLAIPMTVLFLVSEVIARIVDRRRANAQEFGDLADDEVSPLEEHREDVHATGVGEEDD